MTDDALAPFVRAYRDENPGAALDAPALRRRVLFRTGLRQRRRRFVARFALPIAATFFGSAALAAGQSRLPRLEDVREWLGLASQPAVSAPESSRPKGPSRRSSPARPVETPLQPEAPSVPAAAPATAALDELPPAASDPKRSPSAPSARRVEARPDPLSADLAAYQTAHELHFHGGDPALALAAWDAYLASHPRGTFAPEASFNRAVCLLRLGRRSEARVVLVAIASRSGAYGRARAQALLDAME